MRKIALTALLVSLAPGVFSGVLVVRNGRIAKFGAPLERGAIVILDGKIQTVGPDTSPPPGAQVIDAEGGIIYPGLIDGLTTLGLTEIGSVPGSVDVREAGPINPQAQAWLAVHPQSELLPVARANGVTSALVAPEGGLLSGQAALIHLAGDTPEALRILAPAALVLNYPTGDKRSLSPPSSTEEPELKTSEEWRKAAHKNQERDLVRLKDLLAASRAHASGLEAGRGPKPDLVLEALAGAARGKLTLIVRADREADIRGAIRLAEEEKLRIIVAGGLEAWRCAEALKAADVPVFLKVDRLPLREQDPYDAAYANAAALYRAGVRFAIVTDDASNSRNLPYEAAMARAFGLPAEAALRAITLAPAEILGVGDRLGSLEPGKIGDLVVARGDIMDHRTEVTHVIIGGVPQSLETRHTKLYRAYKDRP